MIKNNSNRTNVFIYGAGEAGRQLANSLKKILNLKLKDF